MWESIVGSLIGKFSETAATVYIEKKKLEHEAKMEELRGKVAWQEALTRRASESEGRDADWELESIRNSGWKDELVLIVISLGMVGVFVPPLQPYILDGFNALQQTPEWYRWLIMMIYAATFGIRIWRRKL
jgi:hypothetical protein